MNTIQLTTLISLLCMSTHAHSSGNINVDTQQSSSSLYNRAHRAQQENESDRIKREEIMESLYNNPSEMERVKTTRLNDRLQELYQERDKYKSAKSACLQTQTDIQLRKDLQKIEEKVNQLTREYHKLKREKFAILDTYYINQLNKNSEEIALSQNITAQLLDAIKFVNSPNALSK